MFKEQARLDEIGYEIINLVLTFIECVQVAKLFTKIYGGIPYTAHGAQNKTYFCFYSYFRLGLNRMVQGPLQGLEKGQVEKLL